MRRDVGRLSFNYAGHQDYSAVLQCVLPEGSNAISAKTEFGPIRYEVTIKNIKALKPYFLKVKVKFYTSSPTSLNVKNKEKMAAPYRSLNESSANYYRPGVCRLCLWSKRECSKFRCIEAEN